MRIAFAAVTCKLYREKMQAMIEEETSFCG